MRAVTEYLPVGPTRILSPRKPPVEFPTDLLTETAHNESVFYQSARAAIRAALHDAGVEADDEVLLPGYTCYAVREAVSAVGKPVYVDVTDSFTMDIDAAAEGVSDQTAAIVPIHQYGLECDMEQVAALADRHDLTVVEDAAQALSNLVCSDQVGTYSDYTVLSFRYFKEITAFGGGLLLGSGLDIGPTASPQRFRRLRLSGVWAAHQALSLLPGTVYQPLRERVLDPFARSSSADLGPTDPVRADGWMQQLLTAQYENIEGRVEQRRVNATVYEETLPDAFTPPPSPAHNTYVRYPVRVPVRRDAMLGGLRRAGVGASPMWAYTIAPEGTCPRSHRIADEMLVLPVHAGLSPDEVGDIARTVEQVWAAV